MTTKKLTTRSGFTIVELAIAMVASIIVILGIGVILADNQKVWQRMYNRVNSDVVTDAYVAESAFEALVRKSSKDNFLLDENGDWIEVRYYADDDSVNVDRYAHFYELNGQLNIEYGELLEIEGSNLYQNVPLTTQAISEDVSECIFKVEGQFAQMILTLNNGSQTMTTVSYAVMHKE